MASKNIKYQLWFVCFKPKSSAGHHQENLLKLKFPQELPAAIVDKCKSNNIDPFQLFTSCNREFFDDSNLGKEFLLEVHLTSREGRGFYFYSNPKNPALKIFQPIPREHRDKL